MQAHAKAIAAVLAGILVSAVKGLGLDLSGVEAAIAEVISAVAVAALVWLTPNNKENA